MNLADSHPKPDLFRERFALPKRDLDSRLIWAQQRLCEFREGSISLQAAYFVWGLLLGWAEGCPHLYEAGQYFRIAAIYEMDLDHGS